MNIGNYVRKLTDSYRKSKGAFFVYVLLRVMVVVTLIRCLIQRNYQSAAICILVLLLFLLPALIEDLMDVTIPPLFQGIIFGFIFAAEDLGEINHYYVRIPAWDTILHTINGFLFAAVGFSLVYILNRKSKNFNLTPLYLALVAFCFSMTIGVLWEFFECGMDLLFNLDMQKDFIVTTFGSVSLDPTHSQTVIKVEDITSTIINTASGQQYVVEGGYLDIGILDSMKDLLVNLIGAVVFSVIGFIALKKEKTSKVADSLMIKPKEHTEKELAAMAEAKENREKNKNNKKKKKKARRK